MSTDTLKRHNSAGDTKWVTCVWRKGGLAVVLDTCFFFGGDTSWQVVHEASGMGTGAYEWPTEAEAIAFAERILPLADWTQPADTFINQHDLCARVHAEAVLPGITAAEGKP